MTNAIPDLVDIVDEENRIISIVPRAEARGQLNWISQVILFNSRSEVLVTRRGPNQNFPNYGVRHYRNNTARRNSLRCCKAGP